MFGFGIIGCGAIAEAHSSAISEISEAKIVGVYDKNTENGKKFAEKYDTRYFDELDDMLFCDEVDIVCICTPSGLHAELAVKALMAGKNVIVEKPLALTVEDCDRVIKAEEESGKVCAVISQLRFSEVSKIVKDAINEGKLGHIAEVGLHMKYHRSEEYYNSSSWRGTWAMDGGGALMNQGIHGVDFMINLLGMPECVYAFCRTKLHNIEVEDTAVALVEYKDGPVGVIEATTSVLPGYPRTLEICGTKGSIVLKEDTVESWDIEGECVSLEETGVNGFSNPLNITFDGHKKEFEDVIDAIKNNRKPLVSTTEGKKSVKLICAIYESSKTGKKIIL